MSSHWASTTGETMNLDGLNLVELLDRMDDIVVPEPVSYWPQTVGWFVIGAVALVLLIFLVWRLIRHHQANLYRTEALSELAMVQSSSDPTADKLTRIAELVRRVALVSFPRRQVAGLYGRQWLEFLSNSGVNADFLDSPGCSLATGPYARQITISTRELAEVAELAAVWIRTHKAGRSDV